MIVHQRKVEKSTVLETLSLIQENIVYLKHRNCWVKNMIEVLFVCIESENANNFFFLWQFEKHRSY